MKEEIKMRAVLDIIDSQYENQEIKLILILGLVNTKEITMMQAFELIERAGIFTDKWAMIDYYANDTLSRYMMTTKAAV